MQCSQLLTTCAAQGTHWILRRTAAVLLPALQQHLRHSSCASTPLAGSAPRLPGVQEAGVVPIVALKCSLRSLPILQHSWGRQLCTAGAAVAAAPPGDGSESSRHQPQQQQQQQEWAQDRAQDVSEPAAAAASGAAAGEQQVPAPDTSPLAALYPRYSRRSATAALSALSLPSLTSLTLQCPPNTDTLATACLTAAAARARGGPPGLLLLQGPAQLPAAQRHLQHLLPRAKGAVVPGCVLLDDVDLVLVDLGLLQRAPSLLYPVIRFIREHPALILHVRGANPDPAGPTAATAAAGGGGGAAAGQRAPRPAPARSSLKQQDPEAQEAARRQHAAALSAALRPSMQRRAVLLSNEAWQPRAADQAQDTLAGWAWEAAAGSMGDDLGSGSTHSGGSSNPAPHSNSRSSEGDSSRAQPPLAALLPVVDLTQQQAAAAAAAEGVGLPPSQLLLCYPVAEALTEGLITPVSQLLLTHTGVDASALASAAVAAAVDGSSTSEGTQLASSGAPVAASSSTAGDGALSALVNTPQRNEQLVQAYLQRGCWCKAMAYAVDEAHARQLTVTFSLAGVRCSMVHEGQSSADQEAVWSSFWPGWDQLLVTSRPPPPAQLSAAAAAGGLGMVLMAAPTWSQQQYLARLAPALLPVGAAAAAAAGSPAGCVVVDCMDGGAVGGVEGRGAAHAVDGAAVGALVGRPPLTVADVLPPVGITSSAFLDTLQQQEEQQQEQEQQHGMDGSSEQDDATSSQPASASSASQQDATPPAGGGSPVATITGNLLWAVTADGSWALIMTEPAAAARRRLVGLHTSPMGRTATGGLAHAAQYSRRPLTASEAVVLEAVAGLQHPRVCWLRRNPRGKYLVELQGADGSVVALQPLARGRSLQRARYLAEAWLRRHFPDTAETRDVAAEWRSRTGLSARQISYFQRVGLPYDPQWNRGYAAQVQEAHMLQELQHPTTDLQKHLLAALLPYVPGPLATEMRSKEASTFSASASRLLAAAINGGTGAKPLPARQALLADLVAAWQAGLKLRHAWMVLPGGALVLDLVNGSYLWLTPAGGSAAATAAAAGASGRADGLRGAMTCDEGDTQSDSPFMPQPQTEQTPANSTCPTPPPAAAAPTAAEGLAPLLGPYTPVGLDPAAPYHIRLQTPDGVFHTLNWGSGGLGVGRLEELFQLDAAAPAAPAAAGDAVAAAGQLGGLPGEQPWLGEHSAAAAAGGVDTGEQDVGPEAAAAATPAARGSSRRTRRAALPPGPLPLAEAAARAEGYAARWVRLTGLGRGAQLRLVSMTGGWALTGRHLDVAALPPATALQLKALQSLGLPAQRRYSVLDADRELTRSNKSAGRPDPAATKAQLERLKELGLLGLQAGAARLTYAQARYLLYRAALAEEATTSGGGKGKGGRGTAGAGRMRRV